jgi:hypothetical protein
VGAEFGVEGAANRDVVEFGDHEDERGEDRGHEEEDG